MKQKQTPSTTNQSTQYDNIMAEYKIQDHTDDKNEGHVDTRETNFKRENPDKNLGCDLGIDVMG